MNDKIGNPEIQYRQFTGDRNDANRMLGRINSWPACNQENSNTKGLTKNKKVYQWKTFLYLYQVFNIIDRKTLLDYCEKYPDAANALRQWYYEMINAGFKNFNELKKVYGSASLVGDDRVVFNIMGNKYRLVVRIVFEFKAIKVKWFGTHVSYDKIDVTIIQYKKSN